MRDGTWHPSCCHPTVRAPQPLSPWSKGSWGWDKKSMVLSFSPRVCSTGPVPYGEDDATARPWQPQGGTSSPPRGSHSASVSTTASTKEHCFPPSPLNYTAYLHRRRPLHGMLRQDLHGFRSHFCSHVPALSRSLLLPCLLLRRVLAVGQGIRGSPQAPSFHSRMDEYGCLHSAALNRSHRPLRAFTHPGPQPHGMSPTPGTFLSGEHNGSLSCAVDLSL